MAMSQVNGLLYCCVFPMYFSLCVFVVDLWVYMCAFPRQNGVLSRATEPTRRDTTMTFTTFVMFDMFNALCCRSADKIVPQMDLLANKAFLYSVGGSLVGQVRILRSLMVTNGRCTPQTERTARLRMRTHHHVQK